MVKDGEGYDAPRGAPLPSSGFTVLRTTPSASSSTRAGPPSSPEEDLVCRSQMCPSPSPRATSLRIRPSSVIVALDGRLTAPHAP